MAGLRPPEKDIGPARAPRWSSRALLVLFALTLLGLTLMDRLGIHSVELPRVVAGAVLALFIATGLVAAARRPADYYVADRETPPARGGLAAASSIAGILVAGLTGGVFPSGAALLVTAAGLLLGLLVLALALAPRLRRFGGYTAGDLIAARFGARARLGWAIVAVTASFLLLVTMLTIAGPLAAICLGVALERGLFIAAAVTILAVLPGGMRSLISTQGIQYFLLACGSLAAAGLLTARTIADPIAGLAAPGLGALLADLSGVSVLTLAIPIILIAGGTAALPPLLGHGAGAPSGRQAAASFLWSILLSLGLIAAGLVFVRAALVMTGTADFAPADLIARGGPLVSALPPVLAGLVLAGVLAAVLAAAEASLFAAATALSHDVWDELVDRRGPAGRRIFVARLTVIAVGAAAAWVVSRYPADAPALLGWALALSAAGGLMPLVLGLWWRGCSALGAQLGMLAGFGIVLIMFMADFGLFSSAPGETASIGSTVAATLGVVAAFGVAVLVSAVVPDRTTGTADLVDTLRGGARRQPLRERSA